MKSSSGSNREAMRGVAWVFRMKPISTVLSASEASRNKRSCKGPVSKVTHSTATLLARAQASTMSPPCAPVATVRWTRWEKMLSRICVWARIDGAASARAAPARSERRASFMVDHSLKV
jgi:hypothetical protein